MKNIDYFGTGKASLKGFCAFCKQNILLLVVVTAALFFTYGVKLFLYSIGIDTELFITDKPAFLKFNISIGRYGLAFLQKILYIREFNPVSAFGVGFCLIWLFTLSWCYILAVFSKNTGRNNSLVPFALLFMTSGVWAEQFYFVFQAAETAAMIFLCPFVIYLLYKGFLEGCRHEIICAFILLVLMFSVYQAIIPLFICGVFVCFLLLQENSSYEPRVYQWLCLKLFVTLIAAVAAWMLLGKLALLVFHVEKSDYVDGMNKWGTVPLYKSILNILLYGYQITIGHIPAVQSIAEPIIARFANSGMEAAKAISNGSRMTGNALLLPGAVLFVVQVLRLARRKIPAGRRLLYVLAGIGVPFCIILLPVIGGSKPPLRSLYALPFASAFMIFFLITNTRKTLARVIAVLALVTSVYQAQIVAQLWYSDYVRYQDDAHLAYELDALITPLQDSAELLPVAIVGAHKTASVLTTNFLQGEVPGHSFFEWAAATKEESSRRGVSFMKSLGMPYAYVAERQMDAARAAALTMPSYPAEGSVRRLPDMIVVKLSESTYRPEYLVGKNPARKFFEALFVMDEGWKTLPFNPVKLIYLMRCGACDLRIGGFGLFFTEIIALCALICFVSRRKDRSAAFPFKKLLFPCAVLLGITLAMPENWWARYIPYFWYAPFLFIMGADFKRVKALSVCLAVLVAVNSGAFFALNLINGLVNTNAMNQFVREVKESPAEDITIELTREYFQYAVSEKLRQSSVRKQARFVENKDAKTGKYPYTYIIGWCPGEE